MKRYDSGQTLIEIILALIVVVAVITGITFAIRSSLKNATFSKNQNLATQYAQQGMEILRAIRDKSWATFFLPNGFYCLSEGSENLISKVGPNCDGEGNVGIFIRQIRMQGSTNCEGGGTGTPSAKVTVQVQWSDSICRDPSNLYCHEARLVSCFNKINVVPTP